MFRAVLVPRRVLCCEWAMSGCTGALARTPTPGHSLTSGTASMLSIISASSSRTIRCLGLDVCVRLGLRVWAEGLLFRVYGLGCSDQGSGFLGFRVNVIFCSF